VKKREKKVAIREKIDVTFSLPLSFKFGRESEPKNEQTNDIKVAKIETTLDKICQNIEDFSNKFSELTHALSEIEQKNVHQQTIINVAGGIAAVLLPSVIGFGIYCLNSIYDLRIAVELLKHSLN
jgi:hypothetical protein